MPRMNYKFALVLCIVLSQINNTQDPEITVVNAHRDVVQGRDLFNSMSLEIIQKLTMKPLVKSEWMQELKFKNNLRHYNFIQKDFISGKKNETFEGLTSDISFIKNLHTIVHNISDVGKFLGYQTETHQDKLDSWSFQIKPIIFSGVSI